MSKRVKQGEATAQDLIRIARQMFSEQGYANTATSAVVKAAGVTRGALYHHFDGKEGLFRAVFEDVQAEIGGRIEATVMQTDDGWVRLVAGCRAFVEASVDPQLQQITLVDAPAVLGRDEWRRLDDAYTTSLLRFQLQALMEAGVMREMPLDALAHLLAGAMNEVVLWVAEADSDDAKVQRLTEAQTTLEQLLTAFKEPDENAKSQKDQ